jgi:hypothetical protein
VSVLGTYYWCPEEGACDYNALVGTTGHPIYYQYPVDPYNEVSGGLLQIGTDGSWSFDTNGDFDYLGATDVLGFNITIELENEDGAYFEFSLKLQVGDVTQDYVWEEGP